MKNYKFEPLRVRAYLRTPVVSDEYLPLDGILFDRFIASWFGRQDIAMPRQGEHAVWSGKSMPFLKRNTSSDREWYYACSFAQWHEPVVIKRDFFVKQLEQQIISEYVDWGKKKAAIDITRGVDKSYLVEFYTRRSEYVEWYCRGDKKEIKSLLSFCTHIGKYGNKGYGSVLRWVVEGTDRDWWKNDGAGRLMRAIPSEKGNTVYGIRPSYWHPRHQFKVILP
jgi:CRISPR type IV-associated protein Csf3